MPSIVKKANFRGLSERVENAPLNKEPAYSLFHFEEACKNPQLSQNKGPTKCDFPSLSLVQLKCIATSCIRSMGLTIRILPELRLECDLN